MMVVVVNGGIGGGEGRLVTSNISKFCSHMLTQTCDYRTWKCSKSVLPHHSSAIAIATVDHHHHRRGGRGERDSHSEKRAYKVRLLHFCDIFFF
jgi:hypothetical protein